jgi:hypothetical protein
MDDKDLFLKKMRAMSLIKGELMKSGKDPTVIERILMTEYDSKDPKGLSKLVEQLDLDNREDIGKLMEKVYEKI